MKTIRKTGHVLFLICLSIMAVQAQSGLEIKKVFDEARSEPSLIKQVFVLTHNVYFHKEVSFNNSRTDKALRKR